MGEVSKLEASTENAWTIQIDHDSMASIAYGKNTIQTHLIRISELVGHVDQDTR